jgi:hypothetical protein
MMTQGGPTGGSEWQEVAHDKLLRVLGRSAGEQLLREILAEMGLEVLETVDELAAFGDRLTTRGGFPGALGVVLKTHATLRGART